MSTVSLKTPGVYIQEINNLPQSIVAGFGTVPVFIADGLTKPEGYTWPVKITSLFDFTQLFGTQGASSMTLNVTLSAPVLTIAEDQTFPATASFYNHLQAYFANGGGPCYIANQEDDEATTLEALETRDDISVIVLPDSPMEMMTATLSHCQEHNRFAIFDTEYSAVSTFRDGIGMNDLNYAATYTPYLNTTLTSDLRDESAITLADDGDGTYEGMTLAALSSENLAHYNQVKSYLAQASLPTISDMPPAAFMAGIYCRQERDRGIWQSPANVSISSVSAPNTEITDAQQASLNVHDSGKSVNAIRFFPGRGNLVWGARTLAGNDNNWRYIGVRRSFSYIERSIQDALLTYVFEPNTAMTWLKISTMIESFLTTIWKDGGLAGSKAEDAFFVNIGLGTSMTQQDILEGKLNINIGLAAVRPAEFIVLEFSQLLQN